MQPSIAKCVQMLLRLTLLPAQWPEKKNHLKLLIVMRIPNIFTRVISVKTFDLEGTFITVVAINMRKVR